MIFTSRRESQICQERQIADEATEWLLSLEDRECAALRDGAGQQTRFLRWLNRSPEHIRVFLEISNAYYALSDIDGQKLISLPRGADLERADNQRAGSGAVFLWRVAGALGLVALGACAWLAAGSFEPPLPKNGVCDTQVGERSILQYRDGSAVYLNTASHVELRADSRHLYGHMVSGEAFFRISRTSRPLRLTVDGLQIDSPAAQLNVRYDAAEARISVLEGQLRLSCNCAAQEVMLPAGYELRVDRGNGLSRVEPRRMTQHELDNLVGWRDGRVRFDGQPLAEAARELNRYNRRQLVIADPDIGGRLIGGSFLANDVDSFVATLTRDFAVAARPGRDSNTVLLSRAAVPLTISTTR